jgi:SAM-dependent methyltransferase
MLAPCSSDVVLDVGCGTGDLAEWLAHDVRAYVGVDSSEAAVAQCRRRVPSPSARFHRGELGRDPLPRALEGEGYTLLLLSSVLHYLPSQVAVDRVIAELRSVSAPGALLVIADLPGRGGLALDVLSQLAHGLRRGVMRDAARALVRAAIGPYADVRRRHGVLEFDEARLSALARGFGGRAVDVHGSLTANASRRQLVVRRFPEREAALARRG